MGNVWIVVTEAGEVEALTSFLEVDPSETVALVLGPRSLSEEAARLLFDVRWMDTRGLPAESCAASAAEFLASEGAAVVIASATPAARCVLGEVSVRTGASVVSNVVAHSVEGGLVKADRSTVDDKVIETLEMPSPACLLVNPLSLQSSDAGACEMIGEVLQVEASVDDAIEVVSVSPVAESCISSAERVVGVGRGAASEEAVASAKRLAGLIGAEVGCSMPVAKDYGLLPHETYIGLSGTRISPKVYFAFGISGTSQHLAGVRNSQVIVCVNNDPKAFFFDNADYGIVGDATEALSELVRVLS